MDEFTLRKAVKEDAPSIRALIHAVGINPTGLNWKRFLVSYGPGNKLAACGQIKPHADGSLELASIAVSPEFRGRGLAKSVIGTLISGEKERPLFLMCRAEVKSLYDKFGFRVADGAQLPAYFRRIHNLERIFNRNARSEDRLVIMRLE